ncbi:LuxR family transcriptional regulator [Gordonibacter massiliensis (ex Traore et al. 2017)]|uniref:HTH luxR-type domain-containing protein n=1 Tax=Gordonibacter massiliensis (ex Traore et al. 2017) TaxID=1841863 RepID=A0A842JK47_9ACTN|nr:LuxR family transcriptional regulator [Gordonibacter massiliensis (ex Traore et al. 2017)]MBC2889470.1 hypothetical protein [Gordonibacter massiliensis (ex Traore et al. 2017)]
MDASPEREDAVEAPVRPIGENGGDFEAVLVDGCLGFGVGMGNGVLILVASLCSTVDLQQGSVVAVAMALVVAAALRAGQLAADALQTDFGRRATLCCQAAASVAAMAALGLSVPLASAALAGVGLVATAFLYGRFLERLARKALMLVFDLAFMYVGLMLLVFSQMAFWYSYAMLFVSVALCAVISLLFARKPYQYSDLVAAADSKKRSIKVKGNNHTLLLLGFMLSGSLLAFFLGYPPEIVVVALGAAVGLAGIFSLLLERTDERKYKEALKKSPAFTAALLLLPLPVSPSEVQLALLCAYACLVSLNVIVLLNAVVETSRFDMISPVWLFGQEGSVFFAGIAVGGVLFSVGGLASGSAPLALYATCAVAVVACAWMQIRVNYQVYPFEPVIETGLDDEARAYREYDGQRKTLWQQKREIACERYGLSPREREILQILLKGRDAKYITDTFYISQSTAKTHIYNIYRKFGIHSRQELLDFIEDIEVSDDSGGPAGTAGDEAV